LFVAQPKPINRHPKIAGTMVNVFEFIFFFR